MQKKGLKPVLIMLLVFCWATGAAWAGEPVLSAGQTLYVPVYSHILSGDRQAEIDLTATLSIRNTDPRYPVTVVTVDYYDNDGKKVRSYLSGSVQIKPLGSIHYVVKETDRTGGVGANFIVRWKAQGPVNAPLVEAVMIGTRMQQGLSFVSRGLPISE